MIFLPILGIFDTFAFQKFRCKQFSVITFFGAAEFRKFVKCSFKMSDSFIVIFTYGVHGGYVVDKSCVENESE